MKHVSFAFKKGLVILLALVIMISFLPTGAMAEQFTAQSGLTSDSITRRDPDSLPGEDDPDEDPDSEDPQ